MLRPSASLTVLACLGLMTWPTVHATERWYLMSRHGDCVEVGTLKRRVPELGAINDPQSFTVFMRQKGYKVTSSPTAVPDGKAYEVSVPERELFLLFVTSEVCRGSGVR